MNRLANNDFTLGWDGNHECLIVSTDGSVSSRLVGEVFVPAGWTAGWYLHGLPVDHDPENTVGWSQPEIRDAKHPSPPRFRTASPGQVCFTFSRVHHAGLLQVVQGIKEDSKITLRGYAHAWSAAWGDHDDDPYWSTGSGRDKTRWLEGTEGLTDQQRNATFRLGLDPTGQTNPFASTVIWGDGVHIYNGYRAVPPVHHVAKKSGTMTVFISSKFLYPYKHCDAYWDDLELVVLEPEQECKGDPREQYDRSYYVLPEKARWADYGPTVRKLIGDRRTVGFSWDDAGIGNLDDKTAVIIDADDKDIAVAWFEKWYPGTTIEFMDVMKDPVIQPPTTGWLGIHQLQSQPRNMADFMNIGPPVFKAVDRIDQIIAAYRMQPDALKKSLRLVFRKYRSDEGSFRYRSDVESAATEWIDWAASDLSNELKSAGVPTNQVIVLGPNEVWEHNIDLNQRTIDLAMWEVVKLSEFNKRNGTEFSLGVDSMAVGNPAMPDEPGGEEQWQRILPLARALRDSFANPCFNYHSYGLMSPDHPEWLPMYGKWLQDRWLYYYEWLAAHNTAVPFFSGEGGHVGGNVSSTASARSVVASALSNVRGYYTVRTPDYVIHLKKRKPLMTSDSRLSASGMWLNPGQGWNGAIPAQRAVSESLVHFDNPINEANKKYGKAHYGNTLFQMGNNSDWKKFDWQGDPLALLASALWLKYH